MDIEHAPSETAQAPNGLGLTQRSASLRRTFIVMGVLAGMVAFAALFYKQTYTGVTQRETCDIAQVARNIAEGRGFTTRFIRPFNAGLLEAGQVNIETNHAPLFPYTVSAFFDLKGAGDQTAIWPCLIFFCLTMVAVYLLGLVLFDSRAGLLAAVIFGASTPLLRVGASGGEWPMAALWLTLLLCTVAGHHRGCESGRTGKALVFAVLAGVLLALLYYTHHILIFLIVPLAVYFAVTGSARRLCLIAFLAASLLIVSPWAYRNYELTGFPVLGVNAWEIASNTTAFPSETFFRSTDPANRQISTVMLFPFDHFASFAWKFFGVSMDVVRQIIPMLGLLGLPFAIVGMMYRFRSAEANAVRGLMYALAPLLVVCAAVFNLSMNAIILLAPPAAVLASAYFLLLVDAKKMHPFYAKVLIGGFVFIAAMEAVTLVAFPTGDRRTDQQSAADRYFAKLGDMGTNGIIYTDVPWVAAWRSKCTAVWLPYSDKDALAVSAKDLTAQVVILTPECESYSKGEIWYVLHRVRLWREYMADPDKGLKQIIQQLGLTGEKEKFIRDNLPRLRRNFAVSETLSDLKILRQSNPLDPDDIQIYGIGPSDR